MDLFDNVVFCKTCNKRMSRVDVIKDNFKIRTLQCPECKKYIYHPSDIAEYDKFNNLKQRSFHVKLRLVGNSYAVSIPREIIDFQNELNDARKIHEKIVTVAMEEFNKIALCFNQNMKRMNEFNRGSGERETSKETSLETNKLKEKNNVIKIKK